MKKSQKSPEILAPAGSLHALAAAIDNGADAVYLGGKSFSARANAKNFSIEQIRAIVALCHARGVKVYVAVNTLILDREMNECLHYCAELYRAGVDAVIVADIGLAELLRAYIPDLPLHVSTQAGVHNLDGVRYFHDLGCTRAVCAREVDRENLAVITAKSPLEIEYFVHGALCVSVSGQCLLSSVIGKRSGNRGDCAQPCRLPFKFKEQDQERRGLLKKPPTTPKTLEKMTETHTLSLADNCLAPHVEELASLGVSSLKIEGRMKGSDYVSCAVRNYRKIVNENRNATPTELNELATNSRGFTDGYFTGKVDENLLATQFRHDSTSEKEVILPSLDMDVSDVRRLELEQTLFKPPRGPHKIKRQRTARFYDSAAIPPLHELDIVYLPLEKFDAKLANGILVPPVIFDSEMDDIRAKLQTARKAGAEHLLIGNVGHIALGQEFGFTLHGDFRLNVTNSQSVVHLRRQMQSVLLSPELTIPQMRDIGGTVIVYGRLPLMLLEKPFTREGEWSELIDRTGAKFPVIREGGRDVVFNSVTTNMTSSKPLREAGLRSFHYIFTTETQAEVERVLAQ